MKKIAVLMSTFNGEQFIEDQLDSLFNQKGVEIELLIRDDGSTDGTINILERYQTDDKLKWYSGDNLKPAYSFLNLINNAPKADYYAFCDQDDIWNESKLIRAINKLSEIENSDDHPVLYCSDYQLVDTAMNNLPSNGHFSTTSFYSSIVASNATGCTIVFNDYLKKILSSYKPKYLVMHDDWAHKVCLAVGGTVYYDKYKSLLYRQHENNADGGVHTTRKKISGIISRVISKEKVRSLQLLEINEGFSEIIPKENLKIINLFKNYRLSIKNKMKILFMKELSTKKISTDLKFRLAIIFGYY